jgi:hypothetical protein
MARETFKLKGGEIMKRQSIAISAAIILMLALASATMAADPIIGTWKLNLGKSKFSTPGSAPKKLIEVYREIEDNQIERTATMILADGSSDSMKLTWPRQGGTVRVLRGDSPEVSYVQVLIEPGNWYVTTLHDGIQVGIRHKTFSKNGKIMIQTHKGINRQGKPFEDVEVYDRQ